MNKPLTERESVVEAIIDVSIRSAKADEICIFELGNLNELISKEAAEQVRDKFVEHSTRIKQITNLRKFEDWTDNSDLVQQNLVVKYVSPENFDIKNEILIFEDTVAIYRLESDPFYQEVADVHYADMLRRLFDNVWQTSDALLLSATGSTLTKQYLPVSYQFRGTPVVLYPAKDDGELEQAFSRGKKGSLEEYINSIMEGDPDYYKDADMVLAYVWNQDAVPYCDIWKVMRNDLSDDSGFLYDVRIYADHKVTTEMGVASGNSSIVVTAEEMLLRDLVMVNKLSFIEASDRKKYQARFPVGYVPDEEFYQQG